MTEIVGMKLRLISVTFSSILFVFWLFELESVGCVISRQNDHADTSAGGVDWAAIGSEEFVAKCMARKCEQRRAEDEVIVVATIVVAFNTASVGK